MRRSSGFVGKLPNQSALAWELSHAVDPSNTQAVLVPDLDWGQSLKEDLVAFGHKETSLFFLPPMETDLLRSRGPSLLRRVDRLRFLEAWQRQTPGIYIVCAEALAQLIPDATFFEREQLSLHVGQEIDRSRVIEEVARLGYLPTELVEMPGQSASRGSIVDVFPPESAHPLRIELFEDRIESIRSFHPDSQRRIEDLGRLRIPPCREFVFPEDLDESSTPFQNIKLELVATEKPRDDRLAILDRFRQKSFFSAIDYWGPSFLASSVRQPLEALPRFLAFIEPHALEVSAQSALSEMERNFRDALEEGEWVPRASGFLVPRQDLVSKLRASLSDNTSSLWLSHKAESGLPSEPIDKKQSPILGHGLLESELAGARHDRAEAPLEGLVTRIRDWVGDGSRVVLVGRSSSQLDRLSFLLSGYSIDFKIHPSLPDFVASGQEIGAVESQLQTGFIDPERRYVFLLVDQVLGTRKKRPSARASSAASFNADLALLDLKPGDLVVHKEHGIGRYLGLKIMNFAGVPSELIEIEYKDGNKLFVPVTRLSLVQKYSGAAESAPLDKLGGQTWATKKGKVRKELASIAGELLHLYSLREMARGPQINPGEQEVDLFAATFPYVETADQEKAIAAAVGDLRGPKPMDRLVCGDVGYGKTEVALRAAHAALTAGFQVAVLVPTTLLASQHEATFRKRLGERFPTEGLSRFKEPKEAKRTLAGLKDGSIRCVVGTHKLLGSEVHFKNLGLLVIDEEQRFGVVHKEKIKRLRANVHVLSMSATPIPRTLNMAMSGIKDLSIIQTAPQDRLSVKTYVARKTEKLVREAIETEIKRGGQVFYVHNRVQTILQEHELLSRLLKGVRIEHVHGQMPEEEIEKRMLDFVQGRTQVLLTTSIIESGLDIPNANTLIVDRADHFGLSQLYQLRGRVGRSSARGFAYLMLPEQGDVTQDAEDRLAVLEAYQELGSGFHIASHDLEIRGAGDLLGRSQSGNIASIGFDAYVELLQEAIAEIRGEHLEAKIDPEIQIPVDTVIPTFYIPEIGLRLMFYRKLAAALDEEEVEASAAEMLDRFGNPPEGVKNLVAVMRIKCQLRRLGVRSAVGGKAGVSLSFDSSTPIDTGRLVEAIRRYPAHFQLTPEGKLIIRQPEVLANHQPSPQDVVRSVEGALAQLESWRG
jgi:transcription-repair coupling factor (superfamily II helicase)